MPGSHSGIWTTLSTLLGQDSDTQSMAGERRESLWGFRPTRLAVGLLIVVCAAAGGALFVEPANAANGVWRVLRSPEWLGVSIVVYTFAFVLRAYAWRALLPGAPSAVALHGMLQASLVLNHLLPVKAGEVARPLLAQTLGIPLTAATATTVVARLVDLCALTALALLLLPFSGVGVPELVSAFVPGLVFLTAAVAGLAVLRSERQIRLPRFLAGVLGRLRRAIRKTSRGQYAVAALLTMPSWALEGLVLYASAQALGVDLTIHAAIGITAFTIVFQVFHFTPGGIGVYEASMTTALAFTGVSLEEALVLATATHALKFAYAFTFGAFFSLTVPGMVGRLNPLATLRGSASSVKGASRFEIFAARAWNVLNEGKPFTPVFVLGVLLLLAAPQAGDYNYWGHWLLSLALVAPLALVFFRFDFPLKLRWALWAGLGIFVVAFRFPDPIAVAVVLGAYFTFTVVLWGSVYYHLRIGMPLTNFTRFWRLVVENPDPTSGNFLEQAPKCLLLVLAHQYLLHSNGAGPVVGWLTFVAALSIVTVLVHQWFFTWPPAPSLSPTRATGDGTAVARRVIVIAIDGCRTDRLLEAHTPCIDGLRWRGTEYTDMRTVYPARTVTCFSSMLTGATPQQHGMHSNFVPSLGVKCESVFDVLAAHGKKGRLVGIAHLVDAFGEETVETVTAVTHNDEIDAALASRAKAVLEDEDPDLLVLQLLSVDQTGHARGSYNREYLEKIEETDRTIESFLDWCRECGYLEGATVIVTADHGQGIGIGGHGHMSPSEIHIPCVLVGEGVPTGESRDEPRSITDIAATISHLLGTPPPEASVGQVLAVDDASGEGPLAIIIPAYNEAENLPGVLARVPRDAFADVQVIVVDDGSEDSTATVARLAGANMVIEHGRNRGLGAALRTGLETARTINARAAVYLDADGEYDAAEMRLLLAPIERDEADYVIGSRYLGCRQGQAWHRNLANRGFTLLLSILAGHWLTDGQSGYRAFSRRALEVAEIVHDYNYAQVLSLDLFRKGMRYGEVPINYRRRGYGDSFIRAEYLWRVPLGITRELLND